VGERYMLMKTAKQLERYFKGAANHWRLDILCFLSKQKSMTLEEIADVLDCNIKTMSEHTKRLVQAGLLNKKYNGRFVEHTLSPYGKLFVSFLKKF